MKIGNKEKITRLVIYTTVLTMLLAVLAILPTASAAPTTFDFGDITLSSNGAVDSGYFCPIFDLTQSDITISFTYDANGLVDDSGCHAWSQLGIRTYNLYSDFNPTIRAFFDFTGHEFCRGLARLMNGGTWLV